MSFNPFKFNINDSAKVFFERFLFQFLVQHRNLYCDNRKRNNQIGLKIQYKNDLVPLVVMDMWNRYLNDCYVCKTCCETNKDLLSIEEFETEIDNESLSFFTDIYYNLENWINDRIDLDNIQINPPLSTIELEKKRKPKWKHSHSRIIMRRVDRLLKCVYVDFIEPKRKTRRVNIDLIKINEFNELEIYFSEGNGAEIFILKITARNYGETNYIVDRILELFPNFEIRE